MKSRDQVTITVDSNLWSKADLMAKALGIPRSRLVDIALVGLFDRWTKQGKPGLVTEARVTNSPPAPGVSIPPKSSAMPKRTRSAELRLELQKALEEEGLTGTDDAKNAF